MYRYAGFFAKPPITQLGVLPDNAVRRSIIEPFTGIGILLPDLIGESPDESAVKNLLERVGLEKAPDWLYITYDCWAGRIDYVYGLGSRGNHVFGPVREDDISKVKEAFVTLMGNFGVQAAAALRFSPFTRGFWGEA